MFFHPPKVRLSWIIWVIVLPLVLTTLWVLWLAVTTIWGAKSLSYEVTQSTVAIQYGLRTTSIARDEISEITVIQRPTRGRRHFGTNIVGLKEGRWSFAETGPITLYATTIYPLTVITSDDQRWGISPADPEAFVVAVQSGRDGLFKPVSVDRTGGLVLIAISVVIIIGVTIGVIAFVFPIIRRIGYELTDHEVIIHGRRPIKIPYTEITQVETDQPKGIPIKTIGINVPGLYWGSFSWRGVGRNLKLHATVLRPLVLISAGRVTYGISPEDHETFVRRLNEKLETK